MKTTSILSLLCIANAVATNENDGNSGSVRAAGKDKTKTVSLSLPLQSSQQKKVVLKKHEDMRNKAYHRHLNKAENDKAGDATERNLKLKSKGGKLGSGWWDADRWGNDDNGWEDDDNRRDDDDKQGDDDWTGGYNSGDKKKEYRKGSKGSKYPGSGKSGKGRDSSYWSGDGSGKSGKGNWSDDWSGDWSSEGGWKGGHGDSCNVTVTNLSFEQSFSDLFVMIHSKQVTNRRPIYTFGNRTNSALGELAQDLDTNGMMSRYEHFPGVRDARVIGDFGTERKFLKGGAKKEFTIKPSGNYNRISIAAGFPFANDGAIVLQSGLIYDGAEYFLPALDVGVEANLQTCWSVPAEQEDFPPNSECSDEELSDENDNSFAGENYVSIHRGIQDLDAKDDLDGLVLLECKDAGLDNANDDTRFALYFIEEGYDDDFLLCRAVAGSNCDLRGDDDFLAFLDSNDDFGSDDVLINIAKNSEDFNDFCDRVEDVNKDLEKLFKTLEAAIFDFRNPIAQVEIACDY